MLPTLTPCRGCIPEHQATSLPELGAGTSIRLHHQAAVPLEDRRERPSTDHSVQDPVVAIEALTFAERQLVSAEHIEDPALFKGSWTVIVAQVERNGRVSLRILLVRPPRLREFWTR